MKMVRERERGREERRISELHTAVGKLCVFRFSLYSSLTGTLMPTDVVVGQLSGLPNRL